MPPLPSNTHAASVDAKGRVLPENWAHRGASLEYPENSLASFKAAIEEGAEGIETDVHTTSDGYVLCFHDDVLNRTTNGTGPIKSQPWKGVIEHARTLKSPHQQIPLFAQLVDLLMSPNALHVRLNIDLKPHNDPAVFFPLMREIISKIPDWETVLAPRLILGLWHTKFIVPAQTYLPSLTFHHITASLSLSESHFWPHVSGFSVAFPLLLSPAGARFRERCEAEGKSWGVWTVNTPDAMCVAASWGAQWILTDVPAVWRSLRSELELEFDTVHDKHVGTWFGWNTLDWRYWLPHSIIDRGLRRRLTKAAGPIELVPVLASPAASLSTTKTEVDSAALVTPAESGR